MAFTQVILTENLRNLGAEADVVKVRRGYARNYLIPRGIGLEVTPTSLRRIHSLKAKRAEREAKELAAAHELAAKVNGLAITMILETGDTGKAFGSITSNDIYKRLCEELPFLKDFDRHVVQLEKPIKSSGAFEIPLKLHAQVASVVALTVKPSVEPKKAPAPAPAPAASVETLVAEETAAPAVEEAN